jgi:hypothetical protein
MKKLRMQMAATAVVMMAVTALANSGGHAVAFNGNTDGSGSYVIVPDSDAFDLQQPFTLEAWLNWNGADGYRVFLSKPELESSTGLTMVVWDGFPCLATQRPGAGRVTCAADSLSPSTWTHVAATYDGQVQTVYVNGVASNAQDFGFAAYPASDAEFGVSTPLLIGREFLVGLEDRTFPGTLDEIRIWNTQLAPGTIQEWYARSANGSHPDTSALVAYYQFNEGLSRDPLTHDHTGNGHNGTLMNGAARVKSTVSFAP